MTYNPGMSRKVLIVIMSALVGIAPAITCADIRITEIMYDPEGADSKKEWIEIYNEGPYLLDLSAVKFADKSAHVLNQPPKNGGVGTFVITPGAYAVIASDATTFHTLFPNRPQVIDTAMSLNNTGATIGLGSTKGPLATAVYDKTLGGDGTGESLQWQNGTWIHAAPTPGTENAKVSTVATPVITEIIPDAKPTVSKAKRSQAVASARAEADEESKDPLSVVNASSSDEQLAQTAAAGALGGAVWWIAALALAITTGAVATLISRSKKQEWNIEESE